VIWAVAASALATASLNYLFHQAMSTSIRSRLSPVWASLCLITAIMALVAIGLQHASTSQPLPVDAPPNTFASGRAIADLRHIARTTHPIGTAASAEVRRYLVTELRKMGLSPEVHQGVGIRSHGMPGAGNVSNVLVKLPGRSPGKAVLLAAHYDSAPQSLGAADDGASVAAILETLRVLKAGAALENDVIALFTDGEEAGLLGSEFFVSHDPWAKQVGVVLNFEYRGNAGPMLMYETSAGNGKLIEGLKSAQRPLGNSLMYEVYKRMPNDTDMTQFRRAGLPGLNFGAIEGLSSYHTPLDRVDLFHEDSLQHQGETMVALVRHFGNISLADLASPDSVYFDMAGLGIVAYPTSYAFPLSVLGVVMFAGAAWVAGKYLKVRPSRVAVAALLFLVLIVVFAVCAQLLWLGINKIHPTYSLMLLGDTYNSHWYLGAFIALTLGIFWLLQARLMGRFGSAELGMGAALVWLLLLLGVSVLLPGASFLLLWPLVAVLASFIVCFSAWGKRQLNTVRAAILVLGTAPGILLFAPFVRQVYISLTPRLVSVPVILALLMFGLMSPLLCMMAGRRILPLASLGAGVGLLAVAAATAGFGVDKPRPNNLSYVQIGDSDKGYWLSTDRDLDVWTKQFFPDETIGTVSEVFGDTRAQRYFASTGGRGLAAPHAEVLADTIADGRRYLTLRITSVRPTAKVMVSVEGTDVLESRFEEQLLKGPLPTPWQLEIFAVPPQGNVLKLVVAPKMPFRLRLTDTSYGLTLTARQARASDMMPDPFRDSDTTRVVTVTHFD
jgi:hypothetical protein